MLRNRRLMNLGCALVCAGLMAYAVGYAQMVQHLEPCPLCIFQRVGVMALGVIFLAAAIQHPRRAGAVVYAVLIALAALATMGVATRHLYIQSQPPGSIPACGAPFNVLMQMFSIWEAIRKVLHAGGECAQVDKVLGLAMPAWVLIWAALLGGVGVFVNVRAEGARGGLRMAARP